METGDCCIARSDSLAPFVLMIPDASTAPRSVFGFEVGGVGLLGLVEGAEVVVLGLLTSGKDRDVPEETEANDEMEGRWTAVCWIMPSLKMELGREFHPRFLVC